MVIWLSLFPLTSALSDCDPLDPSLCMLPFPNNFWLRPSPQHEGALRLQFSKKTFPKATTGEEYIDPEIGGWNDLDGFSCLMPITTFFPTPKGSTVSLDNIAPYWDIGRSVSADASTLLLDTVTGERVGHWAELDHASDNGQDNKTYDRAFMLWPAKKLEFGRRYIVAFRKIFDTLGGPVKSSEAFAALRDNAHTTDPDVEERRALFEDIFARVDKLGFKRETLTLAWDFTTGSSSSVTGRMVHMREEGLRRLPKDGPLFVVANVTDNPYSNIARRIEVDIEVPQFVDKNLPGARLVLGADGLPVFTGFAVNTITLYIPNSVAQGKYDAKNTSILVYGHGLFGSRHEMYSGYLREQSERYGYIVVASDWLGLMELDAPEVGLMMSNNLTNFGIVPDRSQQGFLLALTTLRLLRNPKFLAHPSMKFNQRSVLDAQSKAFYHGNSEGGIFGTVYMAISTDITRGVLGVTGGPYSLLLPRSHDFIVPLFDILKVRYPYPVAVISLLSVFQLLWDRADPGGYVGSLTSSPLPGTPAKQIIFLCALGDAQVTNIGAWAMARSAGASVYGSIVTEPGEKIFGVKVLGDSDVEKTALLTVYDFQGVPPIPRINVPPNSTTDTHEGPRRQYSAQEQMHNFFLTGNIINTCRGPCHGGHNYTETH